MPNRLTQYLLLIYLTTFSALAVAQPPALCPENYSEQLNTTAFADAQLLVCVSHHEINGVKQLHVSFINSSQRPHDTLNDTLNGALSGSVPLDIEGELRAIRLASSPYPLKPGLRAVALVLELRNRGVGFDEERQELWLFWPKANSLNLVFNQTIELQRWATNCTQDCQDTVQSHAELFVLSNGEASGGSAKRPTGLAPLELKTQDTIAPANAANAEHFQRTERYEFTGERYELLPALN